MVHQTKTKKKKPARICPSCNKIVLTSSCFCGYEFSDLEDELQQKDIGMKSNKKEKTIQKSESKRRKYRISDLCPICGQYMDLIALGNRNTPYIDGKKYPKMCFICFNVPLDEIQHYDEQGNITNVEGPFYDYRHLRSVEEMVSLGIAETEQEARRSLLAVKRKIKEAGVKNLRKLKLKRPKPEYMINPSEYRRMEKKKTKRRKKRVVG